MNRARYGNVFNPFVTTSTDILAGSTVTEALSPIGAQHDISWRLSQWAKVRFWRYWQVGHSGRTERVGEGAVLLQLGAADQAATSPALQPHPAQQQPNQSMHTSSAGQRPGRWGIYHPHTAMFQYPADGLCCSAGHGSTAVHHGPALRRPPEAAERGQAGDGAQTEGALPKGRRLWAEQEDRRDIVVQVAPHGCFDGEVKVSLVHCHGQGLQTQQCATPSALCNAGEH